MKIYKITEASNRLQNNSDCRIHRQHIYCGISMVLGFNHLYHFIFIGLHTLSLEVTTRARARVLTHAPTNVRIDELTNENTIKAYSASSVCMGNKSYDEMSIIDNEFAGDEIRIHAHQQWNYQPTQEQISNIRNKENIWLNIDGGCVYGGELITLRIPNLQTITVKAKQQYAKRRQDV